MNIAEFKHAVFLAFPNAKHRKAEIHQWQSDEHPIYATTVIIDKDGNVSAWGQDPDPHQAIMKCREKLAAANADRIEAARKLLADAGEL